MKSKPAKETVSELAIRLSIESEVSQLRAKLTEVETKLAKEYDENHDIIRRFAVLGDSLQNQACFAQSLAKSAVLSDDRLSSGVCSVVWRRAANLIRAAIHNQKQ